MSIIKRFNLAFSKFILLVINFRYQRMKSHLVEMLLTKSLLLILLLLLLLFFIIIIIIKLCGSIK